MKRAFSICYSLLIATFVTGQSLQNTEWRTYNASILDTMHFIAKTDSLFVNGSNGSNLITSWFVESYDTLWIADYFGNGTECPMADTGVYRFNLETDTLTFDLLSDNCASRSGFLQTAVLWRNKTSTGISTGSFKQNDVDIFPNPCLGELYVLASELGNLKIFSSDGQLMHQTNLYPGKTKLNLSLPKGVYFTSYTSPEHHWSRKMVFE